MGREHSSIAELLPEIEHTPNSSDAQEGGVRSIPVSEENRHTPHPETENHRTEEHIPETEQLKLHGFLTEAEERRVDDESQQMLQNWYDNGFGEAGKRSFMDGGDCVRLPLAQIVNEEEKVQQGRYPPRYQEAMARFFEKLLDFVDEHVFSEDEEAKNKQFLASTYELFFSYSPCLADDLDTEQFLHVVSRTNRIPEARAWFGVNIVGDLVNRFSFNDETLADEIVESVCKQRVENIIDVVYQCRHIASYAMEQGDWADPCVGQMYRIIQGLYEHATSPLVRDIAESTLERIKTAYEEEAPGIIPNNADKIRRQRRILEDRELREQFVPDTPQDEGRKMMKIATDAVCILSSDALPLRVARLGTSAIPTEDSLGRERLTIHFQRWRELVDDPSVNPYRNQGGLDNLPLLLQDLSRPELRNRIEDDLGIHLTDIPLRSQIQLLRFLADQDASGYKRIRSALHHNPDAATDIANAFLAFAEKPELGDSVLHVAELVTNKVDAVKLFHAYAQFTQDADSLADWAMEVRDHYLSGAPIKRTETLRHLLSRANTIMHNAETQLLSATTPEQQSACVERITRDLEREDIALRRSLDAFEKIVEEMTMAQTTKAREGATDTAVNNAVAQHRKRLEQALHELVLGEQRYALPQEFYQNIWNDCADMKPEVLPQERPMYFPVGISRDLPHWQEVWKGTREAVKPVDLYAWLFWLQNQGKPVELVIADEPQAENFLRQYPERLGTTPAEQRSSALAFARRIGDAEQSMYQEVIKTFDLTNITVRRFAEFRKDESFARYKAVCSRLADHPMWKDAFLAMVKDSVAKNASNAERRAAVTYAVEELALTLSTRGTKISHEGEATYDAIAAALWNVEDYARKHGLQLEDLLTSEKLTPAVNAVLVALQDRCNTGKSRAAKGGPLFTYLEQFRQTLQRIPKTAGVPKEAGISARNVTFAFACPETSSQGFGWRGKGTAGEESVIQPKEPYSTYFPTALSTAFLESDQVVALPNGEIAGKILALPKEQQARYAQEVLRPLLTHFFRVMEKQPKAYRYRLGRDYVDMAFLRKTCAEATTLHELLEFVQQYIVVPASREHPTSIII